MAPATNASESPHSFEHNEANDGNPSTASAFMARSSAKSRPRSQKAPASVRLRSRMDARRAETRSRFRVRAAVAAFLALAASFGGSFLRVVMGYFFLPHTTPASPSDSGRPAPSDSRKKCLDSTPAGAMDHLPGAPRGPPRRAPHPQLQHHPRLAQRPLRAVRFFETLERVIAAANAVPREDEFGEAVALQSPPTFRVMLSPIARLRLR